MLLYDSLLYYVAQERDPEFARQVSDLSLGDGGIQMQRHMSVPPLCVYIYIYMCICVLVRRQA